MRIIRVFCLLWFAAIVLMAISCTEEKQVEKVAPLGRLDISRYSHLAPKDAQLAAELNEALVRLSYGDKTGLYELEFQYLRDERDFDFYVRMRAIEYARMDSLDHIEVKRVKYHGEDSAQVDIIYVFNTIGGSGGSEMHDKLWVYREGERWIKPTASIFKKQREYEDLIRKADSAARAE